jgi:hypothetical protein
MDFAVIHDIQDTDGWRQALAADDGTLPDDFENPVFVEAVDKSRALCVWHAPSQDALQTMLDEFLGQAAVNHVFPINVHRLPQT